MYTFSLAHTQPISIALRPLEDPSPLSNAVLHNHTYGALGTFHFVSPIGAGGKQRDQNLFLRDLGGSQ